MSDSFEPFELIDYARRRWRVPAVVTVSALLAALLLSLVLPKRYTATASIVIEPPSGSDSRIATAVSPIYLESLKTYEQFASSDTLFARACAKFQLLPGPSAPALESFKRRVLRVNKIKDTKILQIEVTLGDPQQAQRVVSYLAGETVALNRSVARDNETDLFDRARKQVTDALADLERTRVAAAAATASGVETSLQSRLSGLTKLDEEIHSQLVDTAGYIAEYQAREAVAKKSGDAAELATIQRELAAQRAKAASLASSRESVVSDLAHSSAAIEQAKSRREQAEAQLRVAQSSYDIVSRRLSEIDVSAGSRSEQLRIIDPGIVPQRPSFPDLPMNCAAALVLGLVASFGYLAARFGLGRQRARFARTSFRMARGGGD